MARYERFSQPPRALSPKYKGTAFSQLTAVDHQRIAMARLRAEENAHTKNMAELHAELFDFSHVIEVDEYGFPLRTPYEVPDTVPSVYVAPNLEGQTEPKKDSVSKEGSHEPSGGTE